MAQKGKAVIFLIFSGAASLCATVLMFALIHHYNTELEDASVKPDSLKVVVAKRNLYQGQTLTSEDVEEVEIFKSFVDERALLAMGEVVGRVPQERILKGEPIRTERLAPASAGVGLAAIIPNGQRAHQINITDGSAVSGFLNPGNWVDVLATLKPKRNSGVSKEDEEPKTVTLLQNVRVLAVDTQLGGANEGNNSEGSRSESGGKPSVTLAVIPEDAERLAHAHIEGDVTLTLRNDIDSTKQITHGAQASKLLGEEATPAVLLVDVLPKAPPPAPTLPKPPTSEKVEVFRGSKSKVETVKP